jgi:YD repeat-containing protein
MRATITIICFFLTLTLFGQVNDGDAFFNGNYDKVFIQKQKIRQILVETYINEAKSLASHFEFDTNGFLTKQTVFDSSGKKVNDYLFTYNRQGDQIERKNIAYDLNKTYVASFNRVYSGSKLVQETSSELPFVSTYIYEESDRKVQSTIFLTPDTSISAKRVSVYTYDAKGKLTVIEERFTESNGSAPVYAGKTKFIYNAVGNITEVIREGKANYVLSYDTDGLLKSKATIMPEEFSNLRMVDKYSYGFWK